MAKPIISPNHEAERLRQLRTATMTLAMMRARQCVKDALKRQGKKVSLVPASEITTMAKTYLAAHREALMSEAMATVHQWALDGVFGKKVQCAWRAKLESDAQPQTQQTSMASVAQMSGAK